MKLFTSLLCLVPFFIFANNAAPSSVHNDINVAKWTIIHTGYQKLQAGNVNEAIDEFLPVIQSIDPFAIYMELSDIGLEGTSASSFASALGLALCLDRLDRMDDVYKELGKTFMQGLSFLSSKEFEDLQDLDEDTDNQTSAPALIPIKQKDLSIKEDVSVFTALAELKASCEEVMVAFEAIKASYEELNTALEEEVDDFASNFIKPIKLSKEQWTYLIKKIKDPILKSFVSNITRDL